MRSIKAIFYILLSFTILYTPSISLAQPDDSVKIGENYYWHGNRNYICLPDSGADAQKYIVVDLSSIVVKENSLDKIEIALLRHYIGRDDKVFNSETSRIIKYKNDENNGIIYFGGAKINIFVSKHLHHFWKELSNRTNHTISIDELYGGHVLENNGNVYVIPRISNLDGYSNTLIIKEINIPLSIKNTLNANRVIMVNFVIWNDKYAAVSSGESSAFVQNTYGDWLFVDDISSYINKGYSEQTLKLGPYHVMLPVLNFSLSYLSNNRQIYNN